jgi:hypothetical protein
VTLRAVGPGHVLSRYPSGATTIALTVRTDGNGLARAFVQKTP